MFEISKSLHKFYVKREKFTNEVYVDTCCLHDIGNSLFKSIKVYYLILLRCNFLVIVSVR